MTDSSHYSADVDIFLEVDGERVPVARCAETSCLLVEPREASPFKADLCIVVDGKTHRSAVYFKNGLSRDSREAFFVVL